MRSDFFRKRGEYVHLMYQKVYHVSWYNRVICMHLKNYHEINGKQRNIILLFSFDNNTHVFNLILKSFN